MHPGKSLYEPRLVERWKSRYRKFQIDEMVRRFLQTKENMKAKSEARTMNDARVA